MISDMISKLLKKQADMKNSTLFMIGGRQYAFDLEKIKKLCITSNKESGGEVEIMEVHEPDNKGILQLASKTVHEVKSTGNPQNDTIVYDMVKLFIVSVLSCEAKVGDKGNEVAVLDQIDFGTRLAFNTLLEAGLLYEIKTEK